ALEPQKQVGRVVNRGRKPNRPRPADKLGACLYFLLGQSEAVDPASVDGPEARELHEAAPQARAIYAVADAPALAFHTLLLMSVSAQASRSICFLRLTSMRMWRLPSPMNETDPSLTMTPRLSSSSNSLVESSASSSIRSRKKFALGSPMMEKRLSLPIFSLI